MTTQYSPAWNNASRTQTCIRANVADSGSAANSTLLDLQVNNVSKFTVDKFGELIITPTARTAGSDALINLIAPADTTRAASTEAVDINFNLARTVQFAAGNITDQRAIRIQAPTYSFASASTITNASTLSISGAPVAGTNATLTNAYALNVESGSTRLGDRLILSAGSLAVPTISFGTDLNTGIYQGGADGQIRFVSNGNDTLALTDLIIAVYLPLRVSTIYSSTSIEMVNSTNSQTLRLYNTFTNASNYERLALQFGTYSSARYAQIATESAGTGIANINFAITPKGTGAFILGPLPDGTATGGNARGANAVDLQTIRSAANQVASGSSSVILGGQRNSATGSRSAIVGGFESVASGAYEAFAFGERSTASGFEGSWATGTNCTSSASYAHARGQGALANRQGMQAEASGGFGTIGDAQHVRFIVRNKTTTNSAVTLFLDGASLRLTIPSGKILHATAHILGSKSDGTAVADYMRQVCIKNVGGTTSLVGTVNTIGTDEAAGTSIAITADDTNDALQIAVTGVTSETWRWVAVVYGVELAYGT